jgi:pre-mRNA-splicing helicase BRR2
MIASQDDVAPFLEEIKDSALKHSLSYGVGYIHESQTKQEQKIVRTLFASGAIQVLVATASAAWSLNCTAKIVIIMGTQYYDAIGQASNDYSMPDLLQMVGRAGRSGVDSKAVYVCLMYFSRV